MNAPCPDLASSDVRPPPTGRAAQSAARRGGAVDQPLTLEAVVAAHAPRVARLARRLLGWRDAHEVDDVVQEVFVAVLTHLPRFRGDASVGTWLTTVTLNQCRAHLRRRRVRAALHRVAGRWLSTVRPDDVPESSAERDEMSEHVRRAVRELPAKYREVVVLRYLEEMEIDDVCRVLGLSRAAVEVRLHRARKQLEERLAEDRS